MSRSRLCRNGHILNHMSDVTHILNAIESGNAQAAAQLLPLVYAELRTAGGADAGAARSPAKRFSPRPWFTRRICAWSLADSVWNSRGHFFAAAAEAMRRIFVDKARRKGRVRNAAAAAGAATLDDVSSATEVPER